MKRSAIIVAGGNGRRMGADQPKQFLLLKGQPLIFWTIGAFYEFDNDMTLILVLPENHHVTWQALIAKHGFHIPHVLIRGGAERFHSTLAGLQSVEHDGLVAVHDGVRPLVSVDLISRCMAAAQAHGAAIPVVPISSSVREVNENGSRAVDRSALKAVQTPQCFQVPLLRKAFELPYDPSFTDEATLVERMGTKIHLVDGEERNLKITTPTDMLLADALAVGTRKP